MIRNPIIEKTSAMLPTLTFDLIRTHKGVPRGSGSQGVRQQKGFEV